MKIIYLFQLHLNEIVLISLSLNCLYFNSIPFWNMAPEWLLKGTQIPYEKKLYSSKLETSKAMETDWKVWMTLHFASNLKIYKILKAVFLE